MRNVVVILNIEAMADAAWLCNTLGDYEIFLFDISLGDPATAAQLKNVKLFTQIAGPAYHAMDREAHAAALTLERELDAVLRAAGSNVSVVGWQHLHFYYFFMMRHWYPALWRLVGEQLRGRHVHVLINDNPANYYFDSFVPSLSLVAYLQRAGIPFTAYDYGAKGPPVYKVPDIHDTAPARFSGSLLTHLPTCVHDYEHFGREIRAAGMPWVDLESPYWNVPLEPDLRLGLTTLERGIERLDTATVAHIDSTAQVLRDRLPEFLAPHFELANYRLRQVEHVVQRYRSQFVTLAALQRYFCENQPAKLVLGEHDTGFLGPLIAFADQRALPVLLLPHSKIIGDIEFKTDGMLALTHPMQGGPVHNVDGRNVRHRPILFPERFAGTTTLGGELRTICLLLNAPSLNGIPDVPSDAYLDGIRRIVTWCQEHGVIVKIRCRGGYRIFDLLTLYLGADAGALARWMDEPLEQHARDCDLCLMYEGPTTGAIVFLRNSIPLLNPTVSVQSKKCVAMLHADLVVAESVDSTLQRLELFRTEPLAFDAFRIEQFQAYVSRYRDARPLRTYLAEGSMPTARGGAAESVAASIEEMAL
jgi:hypothetical protein